MIIKCVTYTNVDIDNCATIISRGQTNVAGRRIYQIKD